MFRGFRWCEAGRRLKGCVLLDGRFGSFKTVGFGSFTTVVFGSFSTAFCRAHQSSSCREVQNLTRVVRKLNVKYGVYYYDITKRPFMVVKCYKSATSKKGTIVISITRILLARRRWAARVGRGAPGRSSVRCPCSLWRFG